jgi:hypothetical protein
MEWQCYVGDDPKTTSGAEARRYKSAKLRRIEDYCGQNPITSRFAASPLMSVSFRMHSPAVRSRVLLPAAS